MVFRGANFIVTPTEKNTKEAIELCKKLGEELGFGKISELSPEKHDSMIAFLSQLTHIIAVTLMTSTHKPKKENPRKQVYSHEYAILQKITHSKGN